jgi:hypothetical protein
MRTAASACTNPVGGLAATAYWPDGGQTSGLACKIVIFPVPGYHARKLVATSVWLGCLYESIGCGSTYNPLLCSRVYTVRKIGTFVYSSEGSAVPSTSNYSERWPGGSVRLKRPMRPKSPTRRFLCGSTGWGLKGETPRHAGAGWGTHCGQAPILVWSNKILFVATLVYMRIWIVLHQEKCRSTIRRYPTGARESHGEGYRGVHPRSNRRPAG